MRDHRKLRAFTLADQIALLVYEATGDFPKSELYGLTSQLRRAAVSVASNIVEGCARNSPAEYLHFWDISFGSLKELHYQLDLAVRLGFYALQKFESIEPIIIETEKVLGALIRSVRNRPKTLNR